MTSVLGRVRSNVSGIVQGVGFRIATARRARALGLDGWVRNLDDGRVECVAEGPEDALEKLLEFLAVGPPGALVTQVESTREAAQRLDGFEIREDGP